jgi:hypothetical protein
MSGLKSRINRLWDRLADPMPNIKFVMIVTENGPPIEWATPTGLILCVPPEFDDDPMDGLADEQNELTGPHDGVSISEKRRIDLASSPPRLIPYPGGTL